MTTARAVRPSVKLRVGVGALGGVSDHVNLATGRLDVLGALPGEAEMDVGAEAVIRFKPEHHAVVIANNATYGLSGRIGTRSLGVARRQLMKLMKRVAVSAAAAAIAAVSLAPTSTADPTTHLKSEIDAARSELGCPPLQLDPVLTEVSHRVAGELDDYARHAATSLPTTGENDLNPTGTGGLLRVLRESGYGTPKAKLLSGYADRDTGGTGNNEDKAIKTTVLEGKGFEALNDCGFTKYGLSVINDDSSQGWPSTPPRAYTVDAVVLVGA